MKTLIAYPVLAALLFAGSAAEIFGQGTAFTYQGRLNDGSNPANGSYDMTFALFDAATQGAQTGPTVTATAVGVTNGLFTVVVDFGPGVFPAANRWLQINVRTNGNGGFTGLTPRQQLTPTPYAVTAENLVSGGLSGIYTNPVTLNNAGNILAGNGAGITGVNAATLGGLGLAGLWQTGGNGGTTPGLNYLGTSDNQPLELKVNGGRAWRLEPNDSQAPNVVGGAIYNAVGAGNVGSTIGGGGAANHFGIFSYTNRIDADFGVIGGGIDNRIQTYAQYATLGGGQGNNIQTNSNYAVIAGGYGNFIQPNSLFTSIGGGVGNGIQANVSDSTISGGYDNSIQTQADHAMIGGGRYNAIQAQATNASISGGEMNNIQAGAIRSFIGGGSQNTIWPNSSSATISGGATNAAAGSFAVVGGGYANLANTNSTIGGGSRNTNSAGWGTIAGGSGNFIDGNNGSIYASIGGGGGNTIVAGNEASTIAGGEYNKIQGSANKSAIGGGLYNHIQDSAGASVIAGGDNNVIGTNAALATISGGGANLINNNATYAVIGGGNNNTILTGGNLGAIGGGSLNFVSGQYATIPGGYANSAGGAYSFAAGRGATAQDNGSFVWADSQFTPFADTGPNQFLIRAGGGVGVGLSNPTAALDVAGSTRVRGVLRTGSESGTTEAPTPAGLVVRRINSTSSANGQIVARTDSITLQRDGTAGGMLVHVSGFAGRVTITWMGINNQGNLSAGNLSGSVVDGFTGTLFNDAEHIVHAQITLGRTYDAGQHLTQVVIDRFDDTAFLGTTSDFYWSGTVISTYNQ